MSRKSDKKDKSTKEKPDTTVIVAVIGAIVTIVVALLGFPPLIAYLTPSPTTTPVLSFSSTSTTTFQPDTLTPSPTYTETLTPSLTPSKTFAPTSTFTPIPPTATFTLELGLPIGMQVKVIANPSSGKKPLKVKIDARDSFLRAPNGDIFECKHGACSYTWYLTIPGGQSVKQQKKTDTLTLRSRKKGITTSMFTSVTETHAPAAGPP